MHGRKRKISRAIFIQPVLSNILWKDIEDLLIAPGAVISERPYSGKFNFRISPELHREIVTVSRKQNISLNKFVEKACGMSCFYAGNEQVRYSMYPF